MHLKRETTRLRNRVIKLFNQGYTQAEVGESLGITRGAVGRLIAEARAMGIPVVRYTPHETAERAQASYRARVGEAAYLDHMDQQASRARHGRQAKAEGTIPPPHGQA